VRAAAVLAAFTAVVGFRDVAADEGDIATGLRPIAARLVMRALTIVVQPSVQPHLTLLAAICSGVGRSVVTKLLTLNWSTSSSVS